MVDRGSQPTAVWNKESIDSGFARFNTIITSLKALDEGFSSKNYVRKFLKALHPKWKANVTTIEESKDLSLLALDEFISNLKVHEVVMEKDSKICRGKKERVKSIALKAKKKSSDDETSTSESDEKEYAMAEMIMIGELKFFLGLQIKQMEDGIFFNQSKYIKEMLRKFGLKDSKPTKTSMSTEIKLTKDDEADFVDISKYQEIKQDDLNQKFLTSLAPEWLMHTIVWRNRSDLDTISLDDLYNHLKVYEFEVQKKSEPNSQNMAFISLAKHSRGNEEVNTASVSTVSTNVSTASANIGTWQGLISQRLNASTVIRWVTLQGSVGLPEARTKEGETTTDKGLKLKNMLQKH
nr:uncharacterized mitochondrial protein AtMg00810-like [Tanacetum cinerariifolium]